MAQTFTEGNYSVSVNNGLVEIIGSVDSISYLKLTSFLTSNVDKADFNNVNLDFRKTVFINSLGIKVFARFIYFSQKSLVLIIDSSIEWQNIAIAPLASIRSDGQATLKVY
jgi:anti-anti-sigma regulatory factor